MRLSPPARPRVPSPAPPPAPALKAGALLGGLLGALLGALACDPALTGELLDAAPAPPGPDMAPPHGGPVQPGLPDTPPPAVDCATFTFRAPPATCGALEGEFTPSQGAQHIPADPIEYLYAPPSSGAHRPQWGRWGEYSWLPPERWLHNLEHGGVALLYHPCAPAELIEGLRALARSYPPDDGGALRWVMTPYGDMDHPAALVAWQWLARLDCLDADEARAFIARVYRQAPEDVAGDGAYAEGWLGR
ncbi:MAG: DUF3105 domain-containing protein [Deltaproteobacteria bacterium]|nr:DUF3105 domain-containing protein [Deltaproteobacteria bacterium]